MNRYEATRSKPVVSRKEGALIGKFDDFQFDIRTWHIYGYRLRSSSWFGKAGGIKADELDQVGRDVVFISTEERVEWSGASRNVEDGRAWASRYMGTKIISRAGTSLGEIDDLVFDASNDRVVAIILSGGRMAELDKHISTGSAAVVIEDERYIFPLPEDKADESSQVWWDRVKETLNIDKDNQGDSTE